MFTFDWNIKKLLLVLIQTVFFGVLLDIYKPYPVLCLCILLWDIVIFILIMTLVRDK